MNADGTDRVILSKTGTVPQWSPQGTTIAFAEAENITLHDLHTGLSRPLLQGENAKRYREIRHLGWSHDSRSITFKGRRRDLEREELVHLPLDPAGEMTILHPNAHAVGADLISSPDNQQVLVGITSVATRDSKLFSLNIKQPGPATPAFAAALAEHKITGHAWSRDGKSIAITSHRTAPYVEWVNGPSTE